MLGSAQRLRRSGEFAETVRGGRRAGRGAVVVHLKVGGPSPQPPPVEFEGLRALAGRAGEQISPARAGFVVSKAVGSAVARNKVRRRLRHLVRDRLASLPPGATLVVRALPGAAELPYARLAADVDAALTAARSSRKPTRRSR